MTKFDLDQTPLSNETVWSARATGEVSVIEMSAATFEIIRLLERLASDADNRRSAIAIAELAYYLADLAEERPASLAWLHIAA